MESYSYNTYSSGPSDTDIAAAGAVLVGALLITFLITIVAYVVMAIFLGKIFKKAGTPSWIAWVPVYNSWKMLEIGGQQGWWALLSFVPIVNLAALVFMYIAMFNIGKKLGKEDWFILVAIFLSPVWIIWLGADSSTWDESKGAPRVDTPPAPVAPATAPFDQQAQVPITPVQPQATTPTAEDVNQTPPTPPVNPVI